MNTRAIAATIASAAIAVGSHPAVAQPVEAVAETNDATPVADAPSLEMTQVTNWILATHNNGEFPFIIIDKVAAQLFVFDAEGQALGSAPVLIGIAKGDESEPGVGTTALSHIPTEQRTTPAGRFLAKYGRASGHEQVLWVDYANAVSLHPVVTSNKSEHRLQRLQSASPDDNRITYGCINVPAEFYKSVVSPLFKGAGGIVYILPESRLLSEVFAGAGFPAQSADVARR